MLSLAKEERLVLICLGIVVVLGVSTQYLLKVSPLVRDFFNITHQYEKYLRLDVNRASYDELMAVPHVGPKLARRILAYREEQGSFENLKDLEVVSGVGPFKFKMIEKYLKVTP